MASSLELALLPCSCCGQPPGYEMTAAGYPAYCCDVCYDGADDAGSCSRAAFAWGLTRDEAAESWNEAQASVKS